MCKACSLDGLLLVILPILAVLLPACTGTGLQVRHVPKDGYDKTTNYQFQARVHADSLGQCQMLTVRVKALSKIYSKGEPPPRLKLFDDDCMSPVRFERVHFISKENGGQVRLSGSDVAHFWSENARLEDELIGWLWRAGAI